MESKVGPGRERDSPAIFRYSRGTVSLRPLLLVALAACAPSAAKPGATTPSAATPVSNRPYFMAVLRRGPQWTSTDTPQRRKALEEHMTYLHRLSSEGKLLAGGSVEQRIAAPRDAIAGVFIFDVSTQAEAEALIMTDPGVAAGFFGAEVVTWFGPMGLTHEGRPKVSN